jgi:hypothetical protein
LEEVLRIYELVECAKVSDLKLHLIRNSIGESL